MASGHQALGGPITLSPPRSAGSTHDLLLTNRKWERGLEVSAVTLSTEQQPVHSELLLSGHVSGTSRIWELGSASSQRKHKRETLEFAVLRPQANQFCQNPQAWGGVWLQPRAQRDPDAEDPAGRPVWSKANHRCDRSGFQFTGCTQTRSRLFL